MVTVQTCLQRSKWDLAKKILTRNMDDFLSTAEAQTFTKERFIGQHCRPVSVPLLSRIYPLQCWPKYASAPLSASVLAGVSVVDLVLALGACWAIFSAWRSSNSPQGGLLGVTTVAHGAILLGYVFLSVSHGFLQHNAGRTGYPVISATLLIYVGKIIVSFIMFLRKSDLRTGFATLWAPGCSRFGSLPAWILPILPGGLLAGYDALSFASLVHLDPATYQVLLYSRIVAVCFMWQVTFQRKLTARQWLAVLIFVAAGITKGIDRAQLAEKSLSTGVVVLMVQVLMSALAVILSEILLKEMPMPTDLLNTCMYFWGLVWLVIIMIYSQGTQAVYYNVVSRNALVKLEGDPWMIGSICCLIAFGIVTAYLLKELSNIVKELSRGFVIIACTVLQWVFTGSSAVTAFSALGMLLAVLGVLVYGTDPLHNQLTETPPKIGGGRKLEEHVLKAAYYKASLTFQRPKN